MAQRPLWWLTLSEKTEISPSLWRIRLAGECLKQFPRGREGDYIKLLLPHNSSWRIDDVDPQNPDLSGFHKRSYTVCEFDEQAGVLTLYFTRHRADPGPAAAFAQSAQLGDAVLITGPGPVDQIDPQASSFLLIGDMPGLGAILANLRRLPKDASGDLIFESAEPLSLIELARPQNLRVHWISSSASGASEGALIVNKLRELKPKADRLAVWAACEYSTMKLLRDYFVSELGLAKSAFYLSSYFKFGATDEQHKQTRREEGYKE
jgi:NADPH-dependent ferric siderophore reductase